MGIEQQGSAGMLQQRTILCVEKDDAVLQSRCEVLKRNGYNVCSASPKAAQVTLGNRKYDLIVTSNLSEHELSRIVNVAEGTEVLVLEALTMPNELLSLVDERLRAL